MRILKDEAEFCAACTERLNAIVKNQPVEIVNVEVHKHPGQSFEQGGGVRDRIRTHLKINAPGGTEEMYVTVKISAEDTPRTAVSRTLHQMATLAMKRLISSWEGEPEVEH